MDSSGKTISYRKTNELKMNYQRKELEKEIVSGFESLTFIFQRA